MPEPAATRHPGRCRPSRGSEIARPGSAQTERTGHCTRPIRLRGRIDAIDRATGELRPVYDTASDEPGGVLHVPCGNRRETVCPPCSQVYKRDARQLVKAGLVRRQGHPRDHRRASVRVRHLHRPLLRPGSLPPDARPDRAALPSPPRRKGRRLPARPRHLLPPAPPRGRPAAGPGPVPRTATTTTPRCCSMPTRATLWRRFTTYLPRRLARLAGMTQKAAHAACRVRYVKVAEYQARGVIHYHAVIRLDAPGDDYQPPPARFTAGLLCEAIDQAAAAVALPVDPGPATAAPSCCGSARQLDIKPIRPRRGPARHRPRASHAGGGELHRQVRHQNPRRPRPARPAAHHPPRPRTRCAARPTTGG